MPSSDADADAAADALQHSSAMVALPKRVGGRASLINIDLYIDSYIDLYILIPILISILIPILIPIYIYTCI